MLEILGWLGAAAVVGAVLLGVGAFDEKRGFRWPTFLLAYSAVLSGLFLIAVLIWAGRGGNP
jgi:hypothetical protein